VIKRDLVDYISKNCRIPATKEQIEEILNTAFYGIRLSLILGERVELRGFMLISTKVRPERTARNPKTGAAVHAPARRTAKVKFPEGFFGDTVVEKKVKESQNIG
jgi:nucleoid DNA-binding protein